MKLKSKLKDGFLIYGIFFIMFCVNILIIFLYWEFWILLNVLYIISKVFNNFFLFEDVLVLKIFNSFEIFLLWLVLVFLVWLLMFFEILEVWIDIVVCNGEYCMDFEDEIYWVWVDFVKYLFLRFICNFFEVFIKIVWFFCDVFVILFLLIKFL